MIIRQVNACTQWIKQLTHHLLPTESVTSGGWNKLSAQHPTCYQQNLEVSKVQHWIEYDTA